MILQTIAASSTTIVSNSALWIPAIAGIVGALVGAIAAIFPNLVVESYRLRKEASSVEASLIAEISALVDIAGERKYLDSIGDVISHLKTQPAGATYAFQVNVPAHYSRIYQDNAHRIGLIDKDRAADIVRFHQLIDAVVQDIAHGGIIFEGAPLAAFEENHQILSRGLALGRKLVGRT